MESKNEPLAKSKRMKHPGMALNWVAQKSLVGLIGPPAVDEVVSISLSGHEMDSYKSLRSIIRSGQIKSKSLVKAMAGQYAF